MGGLAGGRVRSICKRGIPKKRSRSRNAGDPVVIVLIIYNIAAAEIWS